MGVDTGIVAEAGKEAEAGMGVEVGTGWGVDVDGKDNSKLDEGNGAVAGAVIGAACGFWAVVAVVKVGADPTADVTCVAA